MKKTYILSTIMLLAMAIAGCKKGFLSQEVNPNTPSVATPQNILSGAQEVTAANFTTGFTTYGNWLGYWAPSGNYTITATTELYSFTNGNYSLFGFYSNITNYTNLVSQGKTNPALGNFAAIAKIMIAFNYQELVDTYNDVPYTQAENSSKYLFPAYDSGQTVIYPDLLVQLDAAIALIDASTAAINPGTSDIIFGGNMTNWQKFANTLKLRIAIRQSNITAAKAGLVTELATTAGKGYLDDKTFASAQPGYLSNDGNGGQQTPFWKSFGYTAANAEATGHATTRANTFFINFEFAHGSDTLRLKQIYAPTNTQAETKLTKVPTPPNNADHIIGNQFGNDNNYLQNPNTSGLGPGILISPTMVSPIITGAEACFLLSEGIVDGYITTAPASATVVGAPAPAGSAQDYYQRGITANFVALLVPSAVAAAATYYNQPIVDVNWVTSSTAPAPTGLAAANGSAPAEGPLLRAIMTQKYIALFGYCIGEEFNEYRRTALPDLSTARSVAPGALGTGPIPNRIYFPSSEFQTNAASVGAEPIVSPFATSSLIFWARNVNP